MIDTKQIDKALNDDFRRIVESDPTLRAMFTVMQPKYRYYHHKGKEDQYFWTVQTIKHKGKKRYASGIYKFIKTRNVYRLTAQQYHAKRKDAKDRALGLYYKAVQPPV